MESHQFSPNRRGVCTHTHGSEYCGLGEDAKWHLLWNEQERERQEESPVPRREFDQLLKRVEALEETIHNIQF